MTRVLNSRMIGRCLQRYKGGTLIYVGEGRGGVNGDNNFFDLLAESWKLEDRSLRTWWRRDTVNLDELGVFLGLVARE